MIPEDFLIIVRLFFGNIAVSAAEDAKEGAARQNTARSPFLGPI